MSELDSQISLFGQDTSSGKTSAALSAAVRPEARAARISASSWRRSFELKYITLMSLDLTPGAGDLLGRFYWEDISPWHGGSWTLNTGPAPRSGDGGSSLSRILLGEVPRRYYLSRRACLGILRRALERGKPLPPQLETALKLQAGIIRPPPGVPVSRLVEAESGYTAGFSSGAGASAGTVGYREEVSPTLKASRSGSMMPSVLCLSDQGGKVMECSEDVAGTLRAQEHGHQPLVFENHGIDSRYRGPLSVAPTMSARYGTGGLNTPLVSTFSQQRVDRYLENDIASAESARQHKSATDLVIQPEHSGGPAYFLIRRLHPTECERLQGYPDDWTNLPGASDSARYKALGNSICVPCVEYLMRGIALALRAGV